MEAMLLLRLAVISFLPQVLGLHCWGCYSDTSWADCENELTSRVCSETDDPDFVCQTYVTTITTHGKPANYYLKGCGDRKDCGGTNCGRGNENKTIWCEFNCCCQDNCNTGILGKGEVSVSSSQGTSVGMMIVPLLMSLYALQ
ncbi:hypothetical protein OS493_003430 [Desmophyllum pertusum]|uniref:Uncharacterized protein n=1 Tax=Desmophyllum pertusum TaxID=174260 RepID=A0A9X0A5D5_9CNID|nr:hypothetical protein OS493_003430 [Desmophyllum pertusum]